MELNKNNFEKVTLKMFKIEVLLFTTALNYTLYNFLKIHKFTDDTNHKTAHY